MLPEFETVEEFSVDSEVADTTVKVRLRRQTNHKPIRYSRGSYWLDYRLVACMFHTAAWTSTSPGRPLLVFC